jgi:glycosyltransferase involved in cell wall biosynthesis
MTVLGRTMSREPHVSVVTPVHNGADYLEECVESVLAQTYSNWDYTIVDNASFDATPEIASRYATRDSRIRLLRFEEFVDATASYNRAFDAVSPESEFCKVVGADDWLYPECLERMVDAAAVSSTVAIVSAYQLWDRHRIHLHGLPYTTTFVHGHEIVRGMLLGAFDVVGGPTATMLRSAFVRARRPLYRAGFRHEDTEAALWLLSRHDLAFVHQVLTFRREQPQARITWSYKMNSQDPEYLIFLLRYGPLVLSDAEYRGRLRELLKSYVLWHGRQLPRLSRLRDSSFFELHAEKRRQILAEANGDREVDLAMAAVGAMLLRGSKSRPSGPADTT